MKSQSIRNVNPKTKNIKKSACIQYYLKVRGFSLSDIARDLEITPQAVWNVVTGLSNSRRVDEWLKNHIDLNF